MAVCSVVPVVEGSEEAVTGGTLGPSLLWKRRAATAWPAAALGVCKTACFKCNNFFDEVLHA